MKRPYTADQLPLTEDGEIALDKLHSFQTSAILELIKAVIAHTKNRCEKRG